MKTEVIEVQGQKYQVRYMLPEVGSFIYMKMMGALLSAPTTEDSPTEEPKDVAPRDRARMLCALAFMRGLSFEHMQFAQTRAIMVTSRVEGDAVMPLMTDGGKWVASAQHAPIQEDPGLVQKLVLEALAFNLESFFSNGSATK